MKLWALSLLSYLFSSVAFASVIVPIAKWNKQEIQVCFANPSQKEMSRFAEAIKDFPSKPKILAATELEKTTIQEVIGSEFSAARTGIHYVGFHDCSEENSEGRKSDIYIFFGKSGERGPIAAGQIGQDLETIGYRNGIDPKNHFKMMISIEKRGENLGPSYVYIERYRNLQERLNQSVFVNEKQYLAITALHEFGHTAGLAHEDSRAETNQNPFCDIARISRSGIAGESDTFTSDYDPYSIMSYCFINAVRDYTGTHFSISRPGLPREYFPKLDHKIFSYFSATLLMKDSGLILSSKETTDHTEIEIKIGLSQGDIQALQALYLPSLKP